MDHCSSREYQATGRLFKRASIALIVLYLGLHQLSAIRAGEISNDDDSVTDLDIEFTTARSPKLQNDPPDPVEAINSAFVQQHENDSLSMRGPMFQFARQQAFLAWNNESLTYYHDKVMAVANAFQRRYPADPGCYWHVIIGPTYGSSATYLRTGTFLWATFSGQTIVITQLLIDECAQPNICHHGCINSWGGHNCTCRTGYRLAPDGRICNDIDECSEHQAGSNSPLCFGDCLNVPGGYNCICPSGFRMLPDNLRCEDIDECKEQLYCNRNDQICTNTEGGYQCHTIRCPQGYTQDPDQKSRCRRLSRVCPIGDANCLQQPVSYSYNFMAIPTNPVFPTTGRIDLFTMRGPQQPTTHGEFALVMRSALPFLYGVQAADRRFFDTRTSGFNQATISLVRPLDGPQEIELEMVMSMTTNGVFSGKAVATIWITVTKSRPQL